LTPGPGYRQEGGDLVLTLTVSQAIRSSGSPGRSHPSLSARPVRAPCITRRARARKRAKIMIFSLAPIRNAEKHITQKMISLILSRYFLLWSEQNKGMSLNF
jgi:hypothetical protein